GWSSSANAAMGQQSASASTAIASRPDMIAGVAVRRRSAPRPLDPLGPLDVDPLGLVELLDLFRALRLVELLRLLDRADLLRLAADLLHPRVGRSDALVHRTQAGVARSRASFPHPSPAWRIARISPRDFAVAGSDCLAVSASR